MNENLSSSSPKEQIDTNSNNQNEPVERNEEIRELYNRRIENMDRSEMEQYLTDLRTEVLVDERTSLGSNKAFVIRDEKTYIASIDVDSLKWVNDNLGHQSGDELLNLVGDSLRAAGLGKDSYHVSGDEFFTQGNSKEDLETKLLGAQDWLKNQELSGDGIIYRSPGFSFGIAESIHEADNLLIQDKSNREHQGLRAARGEEPNGVSFDDGTKPSDNTLNVSSFLDSIDIYDAKIEEVEPAPSELLLEILNEDELEQRDNEIRDLYTKRASDLSEDEIKDYFQKLRTEALSSELTGLGSNKAFMIREETDYIASVDVDSLKWINDNMSHSKGDELLQLTGDALREAGLESSSYHISGDEFFVTSNNSDDLNKQLEIARNWLSEQTISNPKWTLESPGFSFGIADTVEQAENNLQQDKADRELSGLRAERGEAPPNTIIDIKVDDLNIVRSADLKQIDSDKALEGMTIEDPRHNNTSLLPVSSEVLTKIGAEESGFYLQTGPKENTWISKGSILNLSNMNTVSPDGLELTNLQIDQERLSNNSGDLSM